MSDEAQRPDSAPDLNAVVDAAVEAHLDERGPLLVILQDIVAALGYLPTEAVQLIAERLNLSRAEVHGVVSFYVDLPTEPHGARVVKICRGEACQAVGGHQLVEALEHRLNLKLGATTTDGAVTVEEVFCLGNCALGPSVMVDGRVHGRMDAAALQTLVTEQER